MVLSRPELRQQEVYSLSEVTQLALFVIKAFLV
jgi:hypothetical protein